MNTYAPLATARLFADKLSPKDIDDIIQSAPDAAAAKGDVLVKRPGRPDVVARTGTWFITTRGMGLDDKPESHLTWLTEMLHLALDRIQRRVPDVKVDLSLLVHDSGFQPSDLSPRVLEDATSLGELAIEADDHDWLITPENVSDYFRHGFRSEPRHRV
jgi:hypothetical protein